MEPRRIAVIEDEPSMAASVAARLRADGLVELGHDRVLRTSGALTLVVLLSAFHRLRLYAQASGSHVCAWWRRPRP